MNRTDENRFVADFMDERRKEFHMNIDKEDYYFHNVMCGDDNEFEYFSI